MNSLVKEILAYTKYLKSTHRLNISFHMNPQLLICEELAPYNVHLNPYCTYIKTRKFNMCIKCQELVRKKCMNHRSFVGECHGGVARFICAVENSDEIVGFVSVSGYVGKKRAPVGNELYNRSVMHCDVPESFLKTVIAPLSRMLGVLYSEKIESDDDVFGRIISFVNENHTTISLDMICRKFHFSKSHISHVFKMNTGLTLKSYCNRLKIKDAKNLLKSTDLSVTEIALAVGFDNTSYFIRTFKTQTGITPLAYRKRC